MLQTVSTGKSMIIMAVIALLAMTAFAAPAAAQISDGNTDATTLLCDNQDTAFVNALAFLMNLFFIASFIGGIVSYAGSRTNDVVGNFDIPVLEKFEGKKAAFGAFTLPIGVWAITFLGNVMFGYDVSCIIPLQ